jgi:hypothetical protein
MRKGSLLVATSGRGELYLGSLLKVTSMYIRNAGFPPVYREEEHLPYITIRCRGKSGNRKPLCAHFLSDVPVRGIKEFSTARLGMLRGGSWRFACGLQAWMSGVGRIKHAIWALASRARSPSCPPMRPSEQYQWLLGTDADRGPCQPTKVSKGR